MFIRDFYGRTARETSCAYGGGDQVRCGMQQLCRGDLDGLLDGARMGSSKPLRDDAKDFGAETEAKMGRPHVEMFDVVVAIETHRALHDPVVPRIDGSDRNTDRRAIAPFDLGFDRVE